MHLVGIYYYFVLYAVFPRDANRNNLLADIMQKEPTLCFFTVPEMGEGRLRAVGPEPETTP
jgi:hypothetical protein